MKLWITGVVVALSMVGVVYPFWKDGQHADAMQTYRVEVGQTIGRELGDLVTRASNPRERQSECERVSSVLLEMDVSSLPLSMQIWHKDLATVIRTLWQNPDDLSEADLAREEVWPMDNKQVQRVTGHCKTGVAIFEGYVIYAKRDNERNFMLGDAAKLFVAADKTQGGSEATR